MKFGEANYIGLLIIMWGTLLGTLVGIGILILIANYLEKREKRRELLHTLLKR